MAKQVPPALTFWLSVEMSETLSKTWDRWLKPALWRHIGWNENQLWGEVRTKGSLNYKVAIDRKQTRSSCTCVSRVDPCVHRAALAILFEEGTWRGEDPTAPPHWMEQRLAVPNVAADRRNQETKPKKDLLELPSGRMEELQTGFGYLRRWLEDQTTLGWRQVLEPGSVQANEAAARLVDHRMPGPARILRRLSDKDDFGPGPKPSLAFLAGRLFLSCQVFEAGSSDPLWPFLLQFCGVTLRKDTLKKQCPPVADQWFVIHAQESEEDGLNARNTWLRGAASGRFALLLDFAWGNTPLPPALPTGTFWQGTLHFYPGEGNLRAVTGDLLRQESTAWKPLPATWAEDTVLLTLNHGQDPWRFQQPSWVEGVRLVQGESGWGVLDRDGYRMDLHVQGAAMEELRFLAASGTLSVFGLRSGSVLWPLSLLIDGQVIPLGVR